MLWVHLKCVLYVITMKSLGSFNQSSQCSQHVITGSRPPRPQCHKVLSNPTLHFAPRRSSIAWGGLHPSVWLSGGVFGTYTPLVSPQFYLIWQDFEDVLPGLGFQKSSIKQDPLYWSTYPFRDVLRVYLPLECHQYHPNQRCS